MSIEKRGTTWWYRFKAYGLSHRKSTGLAATKQNLSAAEKVEAQARLEAKADRRPASVHTIAFSAAADEFLTWCFTTEYRSKRNTAMRSKTSFASLAKFFANKNVSQIEPADIERYKTWRIKEHRVRDITLRHDLHALSVFYRKYAIKARWAVLNPVSSVTKPSDKDAVRIHILTREEEQKYFDTARGKVYDLARLILLQGCRPEEILSLRWDDIDPIRDTLRIRGGKSRNARRVLHLVGESKDTLQRRQTAITTRAKENGQEPSFWVFPSPRRPRQRYHCAKALRPSNLRGQEAGDEEV